MQDMHGGCTYPGPHYSLIWPVSSLHHVLKLPVLLLGILESQASLLGYLRTCSS